MDSVFRAVASGEEGMSLVVRGVLTKPCDFGKSSELLDVKDWVDKKLLVPRLVMISIRINEYRSKSALDRGEAELKALIAELQG